MNPCRCPRLRRDECGERSPARCALRRCRCQWTARLIRPCRSVVQGANPDGIGAVQKTPPAVWLATRGNAKTRERVKNARIAPTSIQPRSLRDHAAEQQKKSRGSLSNEERFSLFLPFRAFSRSIFDARTRSRVVSGAQR